MFKSIANKSTFNMPLNPTAADFVSLFSVKFAPENHCYKKPEKRAEMIDLV